MTEPDEFPNGGRRVGPAAAEYLTASRGMWSELTSERVRYRHGDRIVIIHRARGRLADGALHDVTVADVFTVRDGRVVRMHAYSNPEEAFACWCCDRIGSPGWGSWRLVVG
jgi:hypothetical protein